MTFTFKPLLISTGITLSTLYGAEPTFTPHSESHTHHRPEIVTSSTLKRKLNPLKIPPELLRSITGIYTFKTCLPNASNRGEQQSDNKQESIVSWLSGYLSAKDLWMLACTSKIMYQLLDPSFKIFNRVRNFESSTLIKALAPMAPQVKGLLFVLNLPNHDIIDRFISLVLNVKIMILNNETTFTAISNNQNIPEDTKELLRHIIIAITPNITPLKSMGIGYIFATKSKEYPIENTLKNTFSKIAAKFYLFAASHFKASSGAFKEALNGLKTIANQYPQNSSERAHYMTLANELQMERETSSPSLQ